VIILGSVKGIEKCKNEEEIKVIFCLNEKLIILQKFFSLRIRAGISILFIKILIMASDWSKFTQRIKVNILRQSISWDLIWIYCKSSI